MKDAAVPEALGGESFELEASEGWLSWVSSVDHKQLGIMYLLGAFVFFLVAGVLALLMRMQLAVPNNNFLSPQVYNQFFTMHGTTMIFLVVMPLLVGFATYMVPLMIGARDMAFPRLNALSFWVQIFGGLMLYFSFATSGIKAARRRQDGSAYAPLSETAYSYGPGVNYWILGLLGIGVGTLTAGINLIATIISLRAPGMTYPAPAAVRLDDADNRLPDRRGDAGAQCGPGDAACRPAAQRAFLSCRHRRLGGAVAALLLDLRPSRGLHHGAAGLRNHLGGHPGVLAQTDLRLRLRRRVDASRSRS